MRSSKLLLPSSIAFAFLLLIACGDDDDTSAPSNDAGGAETTSTVDRAAPEDSGLDTRDAKPELRCTQAEIDQGDFTDGGTDGGSVEIVFNTGANPLQYTNNCVKLRAGGKVTFRGSFKQHPLEPAGGDEPSPIPTVDKDQPNNTLVVDFPNAGTFGFQCTYHPLAMFGVIQVVP